MLFSIFILVLMLMGVPANTSSNTDDWIDTFDSADSLKDWRVPYGNYTVDENEHVLVASNCYETNGFCLSSLWRNSTASTGTWSFDLRIVDNHSFFILYFLGISATSDGLHPESGYAFHIDKYKVFHLRYRQYGLNPIINSYTPSNETKDWMHFDITRNSTGYMEIFLNYSSIITGQDNRYNSSENINFQLDNGAKLDNVSYKTAMIITTATTTTTTTTSNSSNNSPGFVSTEIIFSFMVVYVLLKIGKKKK